MNRVEAAIEEGRCVLAIGGRALPQPEVLAELRRRNLVVVSLGSEPLAPAVAPSAESLDAVLGSEGGVLVLVEPDAGVDGRALGELERIVKAGAHKPRLAVVAKAFNPFGLPMALRLLKFEQIKSRATDFPGPARQSRRRCRAVGGGCGRAGCRVGLGPHPRSPPRTCGPRGREGRPGRDAVPRMAGPSW